MEQRAGAGVLPEARDPGQGVRWVGVRENQEVQKSVLWAGGRCYCPSKRGKKTSKEPFLCGSPSHLALWPLQRRGLKAGL